MPIITTKSSAYWHSFPWRCALQWSANKQTWALPRIPSGPGPLWRSISRSRSAVFSSKYHPSVSKTGDASVSCLHIGHWLACYCPSINMMKHSDSPHDVCTTRCLLFACLPLDRAPVPLTRRLLCHSKHALYRALPFGTPTQLGAQLQSEFHHSHGRYAGRRPGLMVRWNPVSKQKRSRPRYTSCR